MGQYWDLINVDRRRHSGHLGKLGECILFFPRGLNSMLRVKQVSLLAEPDPAKLREILKTVGAPDEMAIGNDHLPPVFDGLSTEMIDAIVRKLSKNPLDMICFGLCSRRFWKITRPRLEACLTRILAASRCAGDRIICVGDYADDLPRGMLAEGELDALAGSETHSENLYRIAYSWKRVQSYAPRSFTRPLEQLGLTPKGRDWLLWKHLQEPWTAKSASPLVLRDLTSREYVRETALQKWQQRKAGKLRDVEDITLGHVCGFRICWSSEMDVTIKASSRVHRGVWAGHRFDIVTEAEWVPEEEPDDGDVAWRDVSKEVLSEVGKIWAAACF